jgi:GT2 family glycosyltransferase
MNPGIVVVHWRGMADTLACLRSLAVLEQPARVAVVTNGPGDFDEAAARAACPAVGVVAAETNGGYASGCNMGARALLEQHECDPIVLLNNDVTLAPAFFTEVLRTFDADPNIAIVSPTVVYADEPERIWSAGGSVNRWLGYTRHLRFRSFELPDVGEPVDFVSGCTIAIRREAWERLGGMDPAYFHYFEDADLCARARRAADAVWTTPAPAVRHAVSSAAGQRGSQRLNATQAYYFTRNRLRFIRRNFPLLNRISAIAAQPVLVAYECVRQGQAGARWRGLLDGLRGRTGPKDAAS